MRSFYTNLTVEIKSAFKKKTAKEYIKAVCLMYLQTSKSDITRTRKHLDSLKQDFKEQDEAKEVNNKVGKRQK